MPHELPGFYFDAEKNRYFPIEGPIPGSKSEPSSSSSTPSPLPHSASTVSSRTSILLEARELNGNPLWLKHAKCKFQDEFLKIRASHPQVWAFHGTDKIADGGVNFLQNLEL